MKVLLLMLAMLALSGCGRFDRFFASLTGDASEVCHGGVVYLQFTSGATVKYIYDDFGNYYPARCD